MQENIVPHKREEKRVIGEYREVNIFSIKCRLPKMSF